jgi:ParB-like chromosome segregation protein Spo0J
MNIELSKIRPSPKPIRTTWDYDKLNELAQSIEEQGLIVPIKVRPLNGLPECEYHGLDWLEDTQLYFGNHELCDFCEGYRGRYAIYHEDELDDPDVQENIQEVGALFEIVYGHRRVEALRIAGFNETDAIVEGVDDTTTLLQAGMENLSKEDMTAFDKGQWVERILLITDWSLRELERQTGIVRTLLSRWLLYYQESIKGTAVRSSQLNGEGIQQTQEIKKVLTDPKDKRAVADKVENEGLTWQQTRQVAESVAATKDPKMRERLIDAPYSPYTHDPEYAQERADTEVSVFVDFIKKSRQMYEEVIKMDELGKFSPEARPFLVGKLKSTVRQIEKVIERLEG